MVLSQPCTPAVIAFSHRFGTDRQRRGVSDRTAVPGFRCAFGGREGCTESSVRSALRFTSGK